MFSLAMDEMPEMPTRKASIVELMVAPVGQLTVLRLLDRMGLAKRIPGFTWERHQNWITASDTKATLSLNELSGGIRYRLRPLADEPGTDVTTSGARLEEIARTFLDQLGRPAESLVLDRITYVRTETGESNGSLVTQSTLDAGVIFTRTVDELPVVGPGGMAMVKIGTDESVVGGREVWRPIARRAAKVNLRTPDEATDLLRGRLKKWGIDGEVHVRKARLGYAELGIEERQRYLEPCYAYVIETVGGLVDSKKVEVIPAARIGPMASAFASA
jgi:hypothetical protein